MTFLTLLAFLLLTALATSIKASSSTAVFTHRKLNHYNQDQQKDATTANINHQLPSNNNNAARVANGFGVAGGDEAIGAKKDLGMDNHHTSDATSWLTNHNEPAPNDQKGKN